MIQTEQPLDLQRIENGIKNNALIRGIVHHCLLFDRVGSTNQVALKMGAAGLPGGVLIIAEAQEQGRGRLNRQWVSPAGANLYLSLLLSPYQPPREFPLFSMATGVALVHAIRSATGLKAVMKWPNDILVEDKKVAGILLETGKGSAATPCLVVGIGVNVNWEAIPDALPHATSLSIALGHPVDRHDIVQAILIGLAQAYRLLDTKEIHRLIQSVKEVCSTLGKLVRVETPNKILEGIAEDILQDGALLLRMPDQSTRKILLGDITHLGETGCY